MASKVKTKMSMPEHRDMGKRIRHAISAVHDVLRYDSSLYAKEVDRLIRSVNNLDLIRSRLEDVMLRDYPSLTNHDVFAVYYGQDDDDEHESI